MQRFAVLRGLAPFQLVHGKPPLNVPLYISGTTHVEAVDSLLKTHDEILEILKRDLEDHRKMKVYANQYSTGKSLKLVIGFSSSYNLKDN